MKMLGKFCSEGPGGRDCSCCGQAPGKRKIKQRSMKRRERQQWKREVAA